MSNADQQPRYYTPADDELVGWAWDALVADGWTPPKNATDAISRIIDRTREKSEKPKT